MKVIQTSDSQYQDQITALYIEAFSTGLSKQHIDLPGLQAYLDLIVEKGYALLAIEDGLVIGTILCSPLSIDKLLPEDISKNYSIDKCVYVAEMVVSELKRGKGIGSQLLNEFFKTVDKSLYTDAFIRVWDENIPAISLYKKVGFEPVAAIKQTKTKADGSGTFVMQKIYLHKKLD